MTHIHELYDFTVSAFIIFKDKALLHHHKNLKAWIQPGGHVELNEHPEQTLWRELAEETGLTKADVKLIKTQHKSVPKSSNTISVPVPFNIDVHKVNEGHQHIDLSYILVAKTDKLSPATGESTDIKWVTRQELTNLQGVVPENVINHYLFALDFIKNTKT